MTKLRKIAKNIQKQPKLKKLLAEYLADQPEFTIDVRKVKIYGHRGFLAMTEKDLTDMFDKHYEDLSKKLEEAEASKARLSPWETNHMTSIKTRLTKAEQIYTEIFEEVFL